MSLDVFLILFQAVGWDTDSVGSLVFVQCQWAAVSGTGSKGGFSSSSTVLCVYGACVGKAEH